MHVFALRNLWPKHMFHSLIMLSPRGWAEAFCIKQGCVGEPNQCLVFMVGKRALSQILSRSILTTIFFYQHLPMGIVFQTCAKLGSLPNAWFLILVSHSLVPQSLCSSVPLRMLTVIPPRAMFGESKKRFLLIDVVQICSIAELDGPRAALPTSGG